MKSPKEHKPDVNKTMVLDPCRGEVRGRVKRKREVMARPQMGIREMRNKLGKWGILRKCRVEEIYIRGSLWNIK